MSERPGRLRRGSNANGEKALTLKRMADRLGVSVATMSNAFNRPDQLSRELREHILAECQKAGYRGPNAAARSLRTGRTGIVGVTLSNYLSYSFSDPVAHQFLQGLAEVFESQEYSLLLMPSREHLSRSQPRGFEAFVDGFVIYGPPQRNQLEQLANQNKRIVTVDFVIDGSASINVDNYAAARNCAQHAVRDGPCPTAVLGLRLIDVNRVCRIQEGELFEEKSTITVQRLNGFVDGAGEGSSTIRREHIWQIPDNTHAFALEAAREALLCSPRPELLLCMSDRIALGAIQAARNLGLRVPEDVRVTGFDDIPEASTQHPSLTTVHQQSLVKGRMAAKMFMGHLENQSLVLETQLMIRESCP